MKSLKRILHTCLVLILMAGCTTDDNNLDFLDDVEAPSNVSALFQPTQDNSGLVTITPNAKGASKFSIDFGDGSDFMTILQGESIDHIYEEGTYSVIITATGLSGLTTDMTKELQVSFNPPQNLEVAISNDPAISKQVNVTATAEFAMSFEVYFGEDGNDVPVVANIGEVASYVYQEPGTYTIRVVAMGSAIETTEYTEEFVVTEILQPIASAPTQPGRAEADVISVFSGRYTDIEVDYFPDWGQGGCCGSSWDTFDLNGDLMLQYINLSYQGNQFAAPQDVSNMEYFHIDVWNAGDVNSLEISLISLTNGEKPVTIDLQPNAWTSVDIPISDWTDQGLTVADIHQLKYVGAPFGTDGGTVFLDNIYFYKEASGVVTSMIEDFEGDAPVFNVFGNIAATEVIANPDPSGINTTANVAQLTKSSGSEVWAGTFFETAAPLDLATYSKINLKSWSPKTGAVIKVKLENVDASITHEVDMTTTTSNAWENLTYDFSEAPIADYMRVVVFYDFNVSGDGSMYYFDEIELVSEGGISELSFQDFEGDAPMFEVFGNIAATEVIANPDPSGVNTTANVAQLTKSDGSEVWAGTFFMLNEPLDLTTYSKIAVKTWSPKVGAVVKVKLENSDASITHEVDMNTTVADSWEDLVYDFTDAPVADYVRVVIFFDFGNSGDGSVYYFDEYRLTN